MAEFPRWLKPVTLWLLLGLLLYLAVQAWQQHKASTRLTVAAGVIEIRRSSDGHFHWPGRINGQEVSFLVDTGATRTAVPDELVTGLPVAGRMRSDTAGGVVQGTVVRVDLVLQGDVQVVQLPVAVLPDLKVPLLGMDVLSKLTFTQADGVLRLQRP